MKVFGRKLCWKENNLCFYKQYFIMFEVSRLMETHNTVEVENTVHTFLFALKWKKRGPQYVHLYWQFHWSEFSKSK